MANLPCLDCTILVADGGKSEFTGKGGPKAGLINENTLCPTCEGHGFVNPKKTKVKEPDKVEPFEKKLEAKKPVSKPAVKKPAAKKPTKKPVVKAPKPDAKKSGDQGPKKPDKKE